MQTSFGKEKIIGTLVPISSLMSSKVSKDEQGTFAICLPFLNWLSNTHQSAWQFLPLHETQLEEGSSKKHILSPYNSYGIGIDPKYLPKLFKKLPTKIEKEDFIGKNKDWILDYAFFCALRDHFKTDDWRLWNSDLRDREKKSLEVWREKLKKDIDHYVIVQWQASVYYARVKQRAKSLGIRLVGDIPYYISVKSPLVWAHRDVFKISSDGVMRYVSGVPFVPAVHFGRQVWGHPLYNWDSAKFREKIVSFWKMRLRDQASLYDFIRIDHARGFFEYGEMDSKNEKNDSFKKGPGPKVFEELVKFTEKIGLSIFVEDSGEVLKDLEKSLRKLKIPGIKIIRFAINEAEDTMDVTHAKIFSYPRNSVAYTTTHDTETLLGYLENMNVGQKQNLAHVSKVEYPGNDSGFVKNLRKALIDSPAGMVIIPIQDWLLTKDRINTPGTEKSKNDPNWNYVLKTPIEKLPTDF